MKNYLKMILFVVILGTVSTGILMGADYLTKDAVAKNAEFVWKSAVLTHNETSHTQTDFAEVFDEVFEVQTHEIVETGEILTLYVHPETGRLTFRFYGQGLWDAIEGVITLEADFKTIFMITVTDQAETPGLGGRVAERAYLNLFVGRTFDDTLGLIAVKDTPDQPYEVDTIAGATGTSNSFAGLLTANYRKYYNAFSGVDPDAVWKKEILKHQSVDYTESNYEEVFTQNIEVKVFEDLALYENTESGYVSFLFETDGYNGPIGGLITLEDDFLTIAKITVFSHTEGAGAVVQDEALLNRLIGMKFDPTLAFDADLIDAFGEATNTQKKFEMGLNAVYQDYYDAFVLGEYVPPVEEDPTKPFKMALLKNNGVDASDDDYEELFKRFILREENDLTLYIYSHEDTMSYNLIFEGEGEWGTIYTALTLDDDFVTIIKVSVYAHEEKWGAENLSDETLAQYIGQTFDPTVPELDDYTGVTGTKEGFYDAMNEAYQTYYETFFDKPLKQSILAHHNIEFTDQNYETLITDNFEILTEGALTLYQHKTDDTYSFNVIGNGLWGQIMAVVTLESDFKTIKDLTVYFNAEKWGNSRLLDRENLDPFIGKVLPNLTFSDAPVAENEVLDGFSGVTVTGDALIASINAAYQSYFEFFGGDE